MDRNAKELLEKYARGDCSPQEKALIERFYIKQLQESQFPDSGTDDGVKQVIWQRIRRDTKAPTAGTPHKRSSSWPFFFRSAAAAAVLAVIALVWVYLPSTEKTDSLVLDEQIVPGSNKATLILADGREIALSDMHDGIVMGDSITYEDGEPISNTIESQLLTLVTPAGGQYHVTLPDGSQVWLNASSTLKYPVRFDTHERRVQLEGEAYFDVHRVHRDGASGTTAYVPFLVESAKQTINVLGTAFNISAYADDSQTITTLTEGRVVVQSPRGELTLHPGEQSIVENHRHLVQKVDASRYSAWKSGTFDFSEEKLESILQKVSRWYNVSVTYEDPSLKEDVYIAILPRYGDIEQLLKIFEEVGRARFEIKGRTLMVKSKK